MLKKIFFVVSFLATLAFIIVSCKKDLQGTLNANKAPNTYTIIDTIIRSGSNRFQSKVQMHWWGDDPDGFVKYYEYTFDKTISANTQWHKVLGLDSTFVLVASAGVDTADFVFSIRAIDNKGLADPTPARVRYPVKNSPPKISFVAGVNNPTYIFPIVRLYWQATDPDGAENIDHIEMIWNDTTLQPTTVANSVNNAIFSASSMTSNLTTTTVFPNNNTTALSSTVSNFKLQNNNQLFIRAVDISGAKSPWKASYSFYVRKPTSTILLVDAYTSANIAVENFYAKRMNNANHTVYDTLKLFSQLAADNLTETKILSLFKTIIWFGDNTANSLSVAQKTTADFFNGGGKMFMANKLEPSFDENSPQLSITPAQSLFNNPDTTLLLRKDSLMKPSKSGWPTLKCDTLITVIKPMQLQSGAINLYSANLSTKDNVNHPLPPYPLWTGNSSIIAERLNTNNQPVFIYSEIELQLLNGNNNIDFVWSKILAEFGL